MKKRIIGVVLALLLLILVITSVVGAIPKHINTNITFTSKYIDDGKIMPYALFIPSTAEEAKDIPLVVWLHGMGEVNVSKEAFVTHGLPGVINNWTLNGFNAYVLCPHMTGNWNTGRWNTELAKNNLKAMIDNFVMEYNVDKENIIIIGHSLGGQGAMYMAHQLPTYFSRCAVLSGYTPGIYEGEIKIPTIGYVGTISEGESVISTEYMNKIFKPVFGENSIITVNSSHALVPKTVFNQDQDSDNHSDLIEWMFGELTNS